MFTGLVEEKGAVIAVEDLGDSVRLTIRGPLVISDAQHGDSIAVSGVCLTVLEQDTDTFAADVMKESLDTTLGTQRPGDRVNLEVDILATYVERLLGAREEGHVA